MIEAPAFIEAAWRAGFRFYSTVPCSHFAPLLNCVVQDTRVTWVGAANEGDAVAIATGAVLAGQRAVVMMQNSGLGNAVNPLTSLNAPCELPVLLVVSWRGEPGTSDEPQHRDMGAITPALLDLMGIAWEFFPTEPAKLSETLDRALREMESRRRPFALLMRKGSVARFGLDGRAASPLPARAGADVPCQRPLREHLPDRMSLLRHVVDAEEPDTVIVATTGYTGRELYAIDDRPNHFYMVGSMGCALPLALGLALNLPRQRVVVLDGDGALLMRLGAMATAGAHAPQNLIHVLFDNEVHLSTGGQPTVSPSTDFCSVAAAVGYRRVSCANTVEAVMAAVRTDVAGGPAFLHVKVSARAADELPRPRITPAEMAVRLQRRIRREE